MPEQKRQRKRKRKHMLPFPPEVQEHFDAAPPGTYMLFDAYLAGASELASAGSHMVMVLKGINDGDVAWTVIPRGQIKLLIATIEEYLLLVDGQRTLPN